MAQEITAVGLRCGTSLDGVDVAWVRGGRTIRFTTLPTWPALRRRLTPCNLLLDPLYQHATGEAGFDRDGRLATAGGTGDDDPRW